MDTSWGQHGKRDRRSSFGRVSWSLFSLLSSLDSTPLTRPMGMARSFFMFCLLLQRSDRPPSSTSLPSARLSLSLFSFFFLSLFLSLHHCFHSCSHSRSHPLLDLEVESLSAFLSPACFSSDWHAVLFILLLLSLCFYGCYLYQLLAKFVCVCLLLCGECRMHRSNPKKKL